MQELQPQTPNENNERNNEIDKDYSKARLFPTSVIGRKRLRDIRFALHNMGIRMPIPYNSVAVTADYCIAYGKEESDFRANGLF